MSFSLKKVWTLDLLKWNIQRNKVSHNDKQNQWQRFLKNKTKQNPKKKTNDKVKHFGKIIQFQKLLDRLSILKKLDGIIKRSLILGMVGDGQRWYGKD